MNTAPLFEDSGLPLAIMGMLVVFAALTILIGVVSMLPRVIAWMERPKAKAAAGDSPAAAGERDAPAGAVLAFGAGTAAAAKTAANEDEITPELIAVLTAAAEFELGPVRIVRTRPLTVSELAWTLEGRLRHHASHRLQTRNR